MIHECLIDQSVNRLLEHFGARVLVRPPAHAAELAQLEEAVGPLPRSFTIFLSTCDGLFMNLAGREPRNELHGTQRILGELRDVGSAVIPPGLIPVCGDTENERDWLVVEPGRSCGLVVRWEPWRGGADAVGSSFDHYLDSLSRYLVTAFDRQGVRVEAPASCERAQPEFTATTEFDCIWAERYDAKLAKLRADREVQLWLRELNLLVGVGDDFE